MQIKGLAFKVHVPEHRDEAYKKKYEQNVNRFMAKAPSDIEGLGRIRLRDRSVPSSAVLSCNQDSIYLDLEELGRGTFGKVCKIVNASTGNEYAGKTFFRNAGWEKEIEIMKRLHHV